MDRNELPHHSRRLGVPSGVPKMISMPVIHSAQTMQLSCAEINTVSKRTEMSFDLTLVPRSTIGCSQNDFQDYGRSVQTMHLSRMETNAIPRRTKTSFNLTYKYHPGVPKAISTPVLHSVQTVHLSFAEINNISRWIETSFLLTNIS